MGSIHPHCHKTWLIAETDMLVYSCSTIKHNDKQPQIPFITAAPVKLSSSG